MKTNETSAEAANAGEQQPNNTGSIATIDVTDVDDAATNTDQEEQLTGKDLREQRKSDKEWQLKTEKASKWDALQSAFSSDKDGDNSQENADPVESLQNRFSDLESELEKAKWERKNLPADLSEDVEKQWEETCRRKQDPEHAWHKLSYDELKVLSGISFEKQVDEAEKAIEQKTQSQSFSNTIGSIPLSGKVSANKSDGRSSLDNEVAMLAGLELPTE